MATTKKTNWTASGRPRAPACTCSVTGVLIFMQSLTDEVFGIFPLCEPVLLVLGERLPLLLHGPVLPLLLPSQLHALNLRHVEGEVVQEVPPHLLTYFVTVKTLWGSEGVLGVSGVEVRGC